MLVSLLCNGQIAGISASKLCAFNTEPVPSGEIEFEPGYAFSRVSNMMPDDNYFMPRVGRGDSLEHESEFGFRFTYGLAHKLETGIYVPNDLSGLFMGVKYKWLEWDNFSLGLFGGGKIGDSAPAGDIPCYADGPVMGGGFSQTYAFSEKMSLDFSQQIEFPLGENKENYQKGLFISADGGYYLFPGLLFILGSHFEWKDFQQKENSVLFALNPGISVETAEQFLIVLGLPYSIYGKAENSFHGATFGLTILLD